MRTDIGGGAAPRSVEQGAEIILWLAIRDGPPNGKFLDEGGEIPW